MIDQLENLHFIRPQWLLLALPAIGLWWAWRRSEDPLRGWREQMDPGLLEALSTPGSGGNGFRVGAVLLGWLVATLALAGPTWRHEPSPFAEEGAALVIVLKAAESMERPEPEPSRLERAQLKIRDLADARKGQPLALVAYAGTAHLVLPPTTDTAVVASMAAEITPAVMPEPGDRLDLALAKAGDVLASRGMPGSIVVFADSSDGDEAAVIAAHRKAGEPPIRFFAVNMPDSSEDESLRRAARALDAKVVPLAVDPGDVESVVRWAARAPASRTVGNDGEVRWQEGGWFLVPVLAILVALAFRRESAKSDIPQEVAP